LVLTYFAVAKASDADKFDDYGFRTCQCNGNCPLLGHWEGHPATSCIGKCLLYKEKCTALQVDIFGGCSIFSGNWVRPLASDASPHHACFLKKMPTTTTTTTNPTCVLKHVIGMWHRLQTITGEQTLSLKIGTEVSKEQGTTNEWSREVINSLSTTSSKSLSVTAGASYKGFAAESTAEISQSTTVTEETAHSWGAQYAETFATTQSKETEWSITMSAQGKDAWQWMFVATADCGNGLETVSTTHTRDYIYTEGRDKPPCCLPGHCNDASDEACSWCDQGKGVFDVSRDGASASHCHYGEWPRVILP